MARQSYSGDITVYPERHLRNLGKTFTNFGPAEVEKILREGQRATWPKIERIRNTTQISRTFDDCLRSMSERYRYVKR
jgi:hypothetical protein